VQRVKLCRHKQKPYHALALTILELRRFAGHVISSGLDCGAKALWKLTWFLRDFGYDAELLGRDEVDETQFVGLKGAVKSSHIVVNGPSLLRLDGLAHSGRLGTTFTRKSRQPAGGLKGPTGTLRSAYTLTCPRRYRHRYLDGWKEKTRAQQCCSVARSSRG
jgi:hypothetical protein